MTLLGFLDFASVFVFALTGALVASRAQLDLVGFGFMACLTAVGGGTVRDLLLDRHPIFWVDQPVYIIVAVTAAVVIFLTAHLFESRLRLLTWLDSFALAIAVPAGAGAAMALEVSPVVVVLMGMSTGCLGGLMRDVVSNEVPLILKQGELYATAAFAGSIAAVAAERWLFHTEVEILFVSACVTWALRAGSLKFGWCLPNYRHEPPKT